MPCGVQARKSGGTASPAVEARRTVRLATLSSFGLGFIKRRRFDLRYMGPGSMRTRRELILSAAGAAAAGPALAAEPSPHDFVAAIYDAYKGKDAHGRPLDDDDAIRRYFEPKLAAAMIKDRRAAARQVGTLDFDPFVDAQDWEIASFDIAVNDAGPGKASATVKYANSGSNSTVVLDLVKIKGAWKISNITWTPHDKPNTLRGLFAL
jgi:hypothetical protein